MEEELLDVLGNDTRRAILRLLADRPCFKTEIAQELEIGQKAINEHLEIMRRLGLIRGKNKRQERGGPRKYFEISESIQFEIMLQPRQFRANSANASLNSSQMRQVRIEFPKLAEFGEQLSSGRADLGLERLRKANESLRERLERMGAAKLYLERLAMEVNDAAARRISESQADEMDREIMVQLVKRAGRVSLQELAGTIDTTEDDIRRRLESLEARGVIHFNSQGGFWEFRG